VGQNDDGRIEHSHQERRFGWAERLHGILFWATAPVRAAVAYLAAFEWGGGFFQGSTSATSVANGAWHQVTYVNSAGTYAIYVDGVAQPLSSGNSSFGNADLGSIFRLGVTTNSVSSDGTVNFNGLLDNVQIYNQPLTASQVSSLYQGSQSFSSLPIATNVTIASGAHSISTALRSRSGR